MTESRRAFLVLVACILLSAGGIVVARQTGHPADGGRGGALAVALSFVTLFLSRGYSAQVFRTVVDHASGLQDSLDIIEGRPGGARSDALEKRVADLTAALSAARVIDARSARRQNIYLALSSGVGTIAWGFGDWVATYV